MNKCAAMACIPSFGILTDFKELKIGIFCQLLLFNLFRGVLKKKKLHVFHHLETIDEVGETVHASAGKRKCTQWNHSISFRQLEKT